MAGVGLFADGAAGFGLFAQEAGSLFFGGAGFGELALGGCTLTTDDLYAHPRPKLIDAELAAAREVGFRYPVALTAGVWATAVEESSRVVEEAEHGRLLDVLLGVKGKVMLSGYPSDVYDGTLTPARGWTRHAFGRANHAAGGKSKRRMVECLWRNW